MLVVDLEDELGIEFSDRDEDTIAGVVLSELGRRPRVGDRVEVAASASRCSRSRAPDPQPCASPARPRR